MAQLSTQRLPISILVFEIFFRFHTILREIAFFTIVIANYLTGVLFLIPSSTIQVCHVDLYDRGRFRVLFFILHLSQVFLLLFLITPFKGFHASGVVVSACSIEFLALEFRPLDLRVFYWVLLRLQMNCGGVDRTISLLKLVV